MPPLLRPTRSDHAAPALLPPPRPAPDQGPALRTPALDDGHLRAVRLLERTGELRATAALYRDVLGHDVWFRPTADGLAVLSLDPDGPAVVGLGLLQEWGPSRTVVERQRARSAARGQRLRRTVGEERAVLRAVAGAVGGGLRLPDGLLLLCHQWRLPLTNGGSATAELLAVDPERRAVVVLELAPRPGARPSARAERCAALLHQGLVAYAPYLGRVLRAMAVAYDAPSWARDVELSAAAPPYARVTVPG